MDWLEEDGREHELKDHPNLRWLIQVKHGDRVVLLGNPEENNDRLEIVYKLNVSKEHKEIIAKLDNNQRAQLEKSLIMILTEGNNIYNIERNDDNLPASVVIKKQVYEEDLTKTLFFDSIQNIINLGMRATIHFQSLDGKMGQKEEISSTKPGPAIYR